MALRISWLDEPGRNLSAILRRPSDHAIIDPATGQPPAATVTMPPLVGLARDPVVTNEYSVILPDAQVAAWPPGEYPITIVETLNPTYGIGITSTVLYKGDDQPPDVPALAGLAAAQTIARALISIAQPVTP